MKKYYIGFTAKNGGETFIEFCGDDFYSPKSFAYADLFYNWESAEAAYEKAISILKRERSNPTKDRAYWNVDRLFIKSFWDKS